MIYLIYILFLKIEWENLALLEKYLGFCGSKFLHCNHGLDEWKLLPLEQLFSKCGLWTCRLSIARELGGDAGFQVLPQGFYARESEAVPEASMGPSADAPLVRAGSRFWAELLPSLSSYPHLPSSEVTSLLPETFCLGTGVDFRVGLNVC